MFEKNIVYVIVKLAHYVNEMSYNKHKASSCIVFDDASNFFFLFSCGS